MESKWSSSKRLATIADLAMQLNNHGSKRRDAKLLEIAEKIVFLATMDANFLEANASKFSQESWRQQESKHKGLCKGKDFKNGNC